MSLATELMLEAIEADRAAERRTLRTARRAAALVATPEPALSPKWRRPFVRALAALRRDGARGVATTGVDRV